MMKTTRDTLSQINGALKEGPATLHANWRVPMSDCNSTRRTERRFLKDVSNS